MRDNEFRTLLVISIIPEPLIKVRAVPIPAKATTVIVRALFSILANTSDSFAAAPKSQREKAMTRKPKPVGILVPTLSFNIPTNVANNKEGICKIKNIKLTAAVSQPNVLVACRGKVVSKLSRMTAIVQ